MGLPFALSYVALWILIVFHSLILLGVVRMVHQIRHTSAGIESSVTDGVQIGEEAPVFNAVSLSGASVSSADYVGRPTAILFVSPTCPSCTTTLHEMEALHYKTGGSVIVICRASRDDCVHLAERYEITAPMVADEDERISQLFGITIVPTAILIDADNRIQTYGHPMRGEEMEAMFEAEPAAEIPGGG